MTKEGFRPVNTGLVIDRLGVEQSLWLDIPIAATPEREVDMVARAVQAEIVFREGLRRQE